MGISGCCEYHVYMLACPCIARMQMLHGLASINDAMNALNASNAYALNAH